MYLAMVEGIDQLRDPKTVHFFLPLGVKMSSRKYTLAGSALSSNLIFLRSTSIYIF